MSSDDKKSTKLIGEPVFDSINGAPHPEYASHKHRQRPPAEVSYET